MKSRFKLLQILVILITTSQQTNASIKPETYTPSGCVEAQFKVDEHGNAYDIFFTKEIPNSTHTNQAYNNILKMKHKPSGTDTRNVFFQFTSDNSWPLPFECLQHQEQHERTGKIDTQFLSTDNLLELKQAIDTRVFKSIFDSIKVETEKPIINKNENGKYDVTIKTKWDSNIESADDIISYYINTKYGSSANKNIHSLSLTRGDYNTTSETEYNEEILQYIGQRRLEIDTHLNGNTKTTIIGSPMKEQQFCSGKTSTRTNFGSYCFMFKNKTGIDIEFKDIDEQDINNLKIYSEFRISNTYLSTLPNNTPN